MCRNTQKKNRETFLLYLRGEVRHFLFLKCSGSVRFVFGHPGSWRYGSESFDHQAKIIIYQKVCLSFLIFDVFLIPFYVGSGS
jgi:hypothetical protein